MSLRGLNNKKTKSNNLITHKKTTGDWLVMIMNEMATISSDTDLTPIRMLTTWGTEKMRRHGLNIKKN